MINKTLWLRGHGVMSASARSWIGSGSREVKLHINYHYISERTVMVPHRLFKPYCLILIRSYWQKRYVPKGHLLCYLLPVWRHSKSKLKDKTWNHNTSVCIQYRVRLISVCIISAAKRSSFNICPWLVMGRSHDWHDPRWSKLKNEPYKMLIFGYKMLIYMLLSKSVCSRLSKRAVSIFPHGLSVTSNF